MKRLPRRAAAVLGLGAWLAVVAGGTWVMARYELEPGTMGAAPASWPAESRIVPDPQKFTLVYFAHPRCPCNLASLEELSRVMAHCDGRVTAHVLMHRPASDSPWPATASWQQAAAIPGVSVSWDDGGVEARLFGAETSGHVTLHAPDGALVFSGGITPSRGHAGDNAGRSAIVAAVARGTRGRRENCVFGCPLNAPTPPATKARKDA
jgi:hypothetical protein